MTKILLRCFHAQKCVFVYFLPFSSVRIFFNRMTVEMSTENKNDRVRLSVSKIYLSSENVR